MLHHNLHILPLFCLSLAAFACDVDDRPEALDELAANAELESPDDLADDLAGQNVPAEARSAAPAERHCIVEGA